MYFENRPLNAVIQQTRHLSISSRLFQLTFFFFFTSIFSSLAQTNKIGPTENVGIGTINPIEKLHVYRSATEASYNPLMILEEGFTPGYVMLGFKATGRQYNIGTGNGSETAFGLAKIAISILPLP